MKKFPFRLLIVCSLLIALVGAERVYHSLTDGFTLSSITSTAPYDQRWDISIDQKDLEAMECALSQPYAYLASGSQCYVFISKDGQWVIKFFKHKRWRLNAFFKHLPLPLFFEKKRARWLAKKEETIKSTFQSCLISYQDLKQETGMLYLHLNKLTGLQKEIEVSGRMGFKERIPLDNIEFVMQRVAVCTDTYLLALRKGGQINRAKEALTSLLNLTVYRAEMGYSDKDPHLIHNFGFIENQAVQIDIGGFHHDPKKDRDYFYGHELLKIERKLLPWIEKHYPELTSYTKAQIKHITNKRAMISP